MTSLFYGLENFHCLLIFPPIGFSNIHLERYLPNKIKFVTCAITIIFKETTIPVGDTEYMARITLKSQEIYMQDVYKIYKIYMRYKMS